ncbi:MAG: alpha/beta fold hydrolase [Vulcanimicrobiota bacterium]
MRNAVTIEAPGALLQGDLWSPESVRGAVVLANAMAVPRRFYARFAEALSQRGLAVLTFDYRGVAGSAPADLRGYQASLRDWGELDLEAALACMRERFPGLGLAVVGHSAGGQLVGMTRTRLAGVLTVASQSGYWKLFSGLERYKLYLLWRLVLPALCRVFGYMPARRLGLGEDVPRGPVLQWAGWCLTAGYLWSEPDLAERYRRFDAPLRAYWVSDDHWAPQAAVRALVAGYGGGECLEMVPSRAGRTKLGHFGFFRLEPDNLAWRDCFEWLEGLPGFDGGAGPQAKGGVDLV